MKSKDIFNKFRRVEELADRLSQIEQIEEELEEGSIVGIFATNIQAIQYHEPKKHFSHSKVQLICLRLKKISSNDLKRV